METHWHVMYKMVNTLLDKCAPKLSAGNKCHVIIRCNIKFHLYKKVFEWLNE